MASAPTTPPQGLPQAIVLMGVCGSGKTVVGEALAPKLGYAFRDGDGFHPEANVRKMAAGTPLTDEDRWPWLDSIGHALRDFRGGGIIVACSALKKAYRQRIAAAAGRPVAFIHLDGAYATLKERMQTRRGHFMPVSLLDSQIAILEPPDASENAIRVSVDQPLDKVVDAAIAGLGTLVR